MAADEAEGVGFQGGLGPVCSSDVDDPAEADASSSRSSTCGLRLQVGDGHQATLLGIGAGMAEAHFGE